MKPGSRKSQLNPAHPVDKAGWMIAVGILTVSLIWLLAALAYPPLRLAFHAPPLRMLIEALIVAGCLFGGLAMYLFPLDKPSWRLRWLTAGLLVMAATILLFAIAPALLKVRPELNQAAWSWSTMRILILIIFAAGILPRRILKVNTKVLVTIGLAALLFAGLTASQAAWLPYLVKAEDRAPSMSPAPPHPFEDPRGDRLPPGEQPPSPDKPPPNGRPLPPFGPSPPDDVSLAPMHWVLSSIAILLGLAIVAGVIRLSRRGRFDRWLIGAFSLLAASQLWASIVPSAFTPLVSPTDLFRLAFSVSIAFAGAFEIRARSRSRRR